MKAYKICLACFVAFFLNGLLPAQVPLRQEFFFAQIADGRIDEEDELKTIIVLHNPNLTEAKGQLSLFAQDGTGLKMKFRCLESGGPCQLKGQILETDAQGNIPFTIAARGSLQLMTDRADTTTIVGYGRVLVSNNVPVSGLAIFGEFESKAEKDKFEVEIESQAAVEPTGRMSSFAVTDFRKNALEGTMGGVNFEFESETATGLAIINVGTKDTILTLTEFNAGGVRISETQIALRPGQHRSFFLSEVLTVPSDLVVGMVVVTSSSSDITAVALKFDSEGDEKERRNEFTVAPVMQLSP